MHTATIAIFKIFYTLIIETIDPVHYNLIFWSLDYFIPSFIVECSINFVKTKFN